MALFQWIRGQIRWQSILRGHNARLKKKEKEPERISLLKGHILDQLKRLETPENLALMNEVWKSGLEHTRQGHESWALVDTFRGWVSGFGREGTASLQDFSAPEWNKYCLKILSSRLDQWSRVASKQKKLIELRKDTKKLIDEAKKLGLNTDSYSLFTHQNLFSYYEKMNQVLDDSVGYSAEYRGLKKQIENLTLKIRERHKEVARQHQASAKSKRMPQFDIEALPVKSRTSDSFSFSLSRFFSVFSSSATSNKQIKEMRKDDSQRNLRRSRQTVRL